MDTGRNGDRKDFKVVGRSDLVGRFTANMATGAVTYPRDVVYPDMLFGTVLRCPYGRANIKSIDTSQAEKLAGVRAVIKWDDPEIKAMPKPYSADAVLSNQAHREGEEIGVTIAADSEEICEQALKLVKVDWDILTHILTPEESLAAGAVVLQPEITPNTNLVTQTIWEDGNVQTGFASAAHIIEFDLALPLMNNFWSAPTTHACYWEQDESGSPGMTLVMPGDFRNSSINAAKAAFNIPEDKIRISLPFGPSTF